MRDVTPDDGKPALRAKLLAVRAARSDEERTAAARAIAEHARDHLGTGGGTVAAYLSVGSEPPTGPLLAALAEAGKRLIVPVLGHDSNLDWADFTPGDPVRDGLRRTIHPHGPLLGADALALADTIIVPALAVDRRGRRLGRGGGSYDRALARVFGVRARGDASGAGTGVPVAARPAGVEVLAVVFADEVLDELPVEPHDRNVDGALTPDGVTIFAADPPS